MKIVVKILTSTNLQKIYDEYRYITVFETKVDEEHLKISKIKYKLMSIVKWKE